MSKYFVGIASLTVVVLCFCSSSIASADEKAVPENEAVAKSTKAVDDSQNWKSLFDGKTLDGWAVPKSAVAGEVKVADGVIVFVRGDLSTGIKYAKPFPTTNYEIMYQAKRVEGYDFFGALTFPVKDSFCTFVNGGWGGGVNGLSSINGYDASENETTRYNEYELDKWYQFRVRVTDDRIVVWVKLLDEEKSESENDKAKSSDKKVGDEKTDNTKSDEPLIDFKLEDKKISTRLEVRPYQPLGLTSWCTTGHLRNIKYREIPLAEKHKTSVE